MSSDRLLSVLAKIKFSQWIDSGLLPNIQWSLPPTARRLSPPPATRTDTETVQVLTESIAVSIDTTDLLWTIPYHIKKLESHHLWHGWLLASLWGRAIRITNGPQHFDQTIEPDRLPSRTMDYLFYQLIWDTDQRPATQPLQQPDIGHQLTTIQGHRLGQVFLSAPHERYYTPHLQSCTESQRIFVHGSYLINIARSGHWGYQRARQELTDAVRLGYSGWIVHLGSKLQQPLEQAIANTNLFIESLLPMATPNCPLILETSAAEGGDILTTPDDLLDLMLRYDHPCLRLCIDTCHVFSAGFDPLYFLQYIPARYIAVVHFNDSQGPRSCHRDRHAPPGLGYIGYDKMMAIYEYCTQLGIPMIQE